MQGLQSLSLSIIFCTLGQPALAVQERPAPVQGESPEPSATASAPSRMAWYTSLDEARADAKRLNLPILVQSAAPQCRSVPGMW